MAYSHNFVATVKVGSKILRENKEVVTLPFGSEYSIYLKNQNSVRAIVRVSIDGQNLSDVADGWVIIGANQTLELERFIRNGNFDKGNRLKFIERTAQIEEYKGGIGIDDGLIRVEYKFEVTNSYPYYTTFTNTCGSLQGGQTLGNINTCEANFGANTLRSARIKGSSSGPSGQSRSVQAQQMNMMMKQESLDLNEAGITVAGSESNQKFGWGEWFATEDTSHVIILKLVGKVGNNVLVARPVTVQQKPVCTTCGKVNKATFKFCGVCGTALQLL